MKPSAQYLRTRFAYDLHCLTWKPKPELTPNALTWNAQFADRPAGSELHGRLRVRLDGKGYPAHWIIWVMMTGDYPSEGMMIDHIDRNGLNNAWTNLRLVTHSQSNMNRGTHRNNSSGIKGVRHTSAGRWIAAIKIDGKKIHLGTFATAAEAHRAYSEASGRLHGNYGCADARVDPATVVESRVIPPVRIGDIRLCARCNQWKRTTDFYERGYCKPCQKQYCAERSRLRRVIAS